MKLFLRNLKVLFYCLLVITIFGLFAGVMIFLFVEGITNQWVWGSVILIIFVVVTWFAKWYVDWQHGGILLIVIISIMGTTMDFQGNPIYNAPLQFFYRHLGTLDVSHTSTTINGSTGTNYYFSIINQSSRVVKKLNPWGITGFRFFEYLILYSILLSIFVTLFKWIRQASQRNK